MLKRIREAQSVHAKHHTLVWLILITTAQLLVPLAVRGALPIHRLQRVLEVPDIMPTSLPFMCTILSILLDRVDEWFHANGIRTVILLQVVDIELDSVPLANVANGEEVPLTVGESVVVEIQEEIVLAVSNAFNFPQITRLELWIEKDGFIVYVLDIEWLGRISQLFRFEVRSYTLSFDWIPDEFPYM
mgnify:CR=1 FL=1